jgi:basic membrane protein A
MRVKYINTWNSYSLEKEAAEQLIKEGCVIISHHSNTVGSAIACENSDMPYPVYHVAYNQDMIDYAPTSELISCRIDWSEYIISAVNAVLDNKKIEKKVNGKVNGFDTSGGLKEGWVKMMEINSAIAPKGCKELVQQAEKDMSKGRIHVFKGDYIGVDPDDPSDTYDLNKEYIENEKSSAPTFHYVLKDIITVTY